MRIAATGEGYGVFVDGQLFAATGDFETGFEPTERLLMGRRVAPVRPSKIVCAARNYADHAREMGGEPPDEPRVFLKAPSALIGPDQPIVLPPNAGRVDPEGELAVVIGRRSRHLTRDNALDAVFGYTLVNDVTARVFQKKDRIFGRAKSFDTFCPCGPWIDTDFDPTDVAIETSVNGEVRASGRTSQMLFGIVDLLVWVSAVMTLEPGDLLATGTPPGVAPLASGDRVEVRVQGLGVLSNPVR